MDFRTATPKVLQRCVDVLATPSPKPDFLPRDPAAYASHSDIQRFRTIKAKHHFAYHRAKHARPLEKIHAAMTVFDPFSRTALLDRLTTYTALNWTPNQALSELKCAQNGWKCVSIALSANTRNRLMCTACGSQITLRYNAVGTAPFDFDLDDIDELNAALAAQYRPQIEHTAHKDSCTWKTFETPLEGVYYLRPHIHSSNEQLVDDYLKNLRSLVDNTPVLIDRASLFAAIGSPEDGFVKASNSALLARYFRDNKENFSALLELTPRWFYVLAVYGWDLHIQSFSTKLVLLLICTKCNKRVFLNASEHAPVAKNSAHAISQPDINVSSLKVLTPCKFPPVLEALVLDADAFGSENEDDGLFDPVAEHKPWCCNVHDMGGISFYDYFVRMFEDAERDMDTDGNISRDSEMALDLQTPQKRPHGFDVNEGIERLTKLRKLYLLDE